jgi:hypothetical protein
MDDEEFTEAVKESKSIANVIRWEIVGMESLLRNHPR